MARTRKIHVQTEMTFKSLDKNGQLRGGARSKTGPKPKLDAGGRQRMSHVKRPSIDHRHPQHVTLRVSPEIGWMRKLDVYAAIRGALRKVLPRRSDFRIAQYSVQDTHIHLIVEAEHKKALAAGLRAFQISAAKRINAVISRRRRMDRRRRGVVFTDRYHAEDLSSVRQVRNALAYVMNNWRRHRVDSRDPSRRLCDGRLDPYASGLAYPGWREPLSLQRPRDYEPPPVAEPRSWLLTTGWTKAPLISCLEVPGPRSPKDRAR
ncbi:MAG: transposase [Kofleriaceae bacterium]